MRRAAIDLYRDIAVSASRRSTMRHQVGCVLANNGGNTHVVAFNRYLGDPNGAGWSMHAEVWAIVKANVLGVPATNAFIARSTHRLARPCPKCMAALASHGIKIVHYTTAPGEWATEGIG